MTWGSAYTWNPFILGWCYRCTLCAPRCYVQRSVGEPLISPAQSCSFIMIVLIFCIVGLLIEPLYADLAASVYYPTIYEIKRRHNHCLNARFERGDFATFELFIIDADEDGYPKASVAIDGPVISPKIGVIDPESGIRSWPVSEEDKTKTLGAAMKRSIDAWPAFINNNRKHFTEAGIIHHVSIVCMEQLILVIQSLYICCVSLFINMCVKNLTPQTLSLSPLSRMLL